MASLDIPPWHHFLNTSWKGEVVGVSLTGAQVIHQWVRGGGKAHQNRSLQGRPSEAHWQRGRWEQYTSLLAQIREVVTWSKKWDQALDWGPGAANDARSLFHLLCTPVFTDRTYPTCSEQITLTSNYLMHVCHTCDINVDVIDLFSNAIEDFQWVITVKKYWYPKNRKVSWECRTCGLK